MTYNSVLVTGFAVNSDGSAIQNGHIHFVPSDICWNTSTGQVIVVAGVDFVFNGSLLPPGVQLFAMDNTGVSTNWSWIFYGEANGNPFLPRVLTVNYASATGTPPSIPLVSLLAAAAPMATPLNLSPFTGGSNS